MQRRIWEGRLARAVRQRLSKSPKSWRRAKEKTRMSSAADRDAAPSPSTSPCTSAISRSEVIGSFCLDDLMDGEAELQSKLRVLQKQPLS